MSEVYIRSQDKEGLYTIKESCGIRYKEFTNAGMKENRIMLNMDATSMYTLGIFESKERCIEIIDEIQSVCGRYLYAPGNTGLLIGSEATPPMAAVIPRLYQMPEK